MDCFLMLFLAEKKELLIHPLSLIESKIQITIKPKTNNPPI